MAAAMRICLFFKSQKSLTAAALLAYQNGSKVERAPVEGVGVSIWCRGPQGPLIRVCGVSMDSFFQGGSNDTIGELGRHQQPEISPF